MHTLQVSHFKPKKFDCVKKSQKLPSSFRANCEIVLDLPHRLAPPLAHNANLATPSSLHLALNTAMERLKLATTRRLHFGADGDNSAHG
jgi:hypothetical protein